MEKKLLLFLDIDGVLNNHTFNEISKSYTLKQDCIRYLNHIIHELNPIVCLSSAWRYMILKEAMTTQGFKYLLQTHGVTAKLNLVGQCGLDVSEGHERGKIIHNWFQAFKGNEDWNILILDDAPKGMSFEPMQQYLYQTDGNRGLTKEDMDNILKKYKRTCF